MLPLASHAAGTPIVLTGNPLPAQSPDWYRPAPSFTRSVSRLLRPILRAGEPFVGRPRALAGRIPARAGHPLDEVIVAAPGWPSGMAAKGHRGMGDILEPIFAALLDEIVILDRVPAASVRLSTIQSRRMS